MLDIAAKRTAEPATTPFDVSELQSFLRIDGLADTYEQALLELLIKAAVGVCENYCRIALIQQTWQAKLDGFCDEIVLPRPPLISVASITYIDTNGTQQTLDSSVYQVDTFSRPGRINLAYGQSWPSTRDQRQAVTITWTAGYGAAATAVPENLKNGLKLLCGSWYGMRDDLDLGKTNEIPLPWAVRLLFDQAALAQVW